ncbi:hypothetical protein OESDEN_04404 [Oesophagostomum dentatum]|uniref:Uncharacterized protein n=1 Tax=Oesophagostomum dentatum TaxID=61180 RepID=A0A0B1TJV4_OESDE|nr:hypothetical protein OESDEN_04404 [Oesophagostomum dentatum]
MALFSDTYYWKIFEMAKPAIDKVYSRHDEHVMDVVLSNYQAGESLHLAADDAYDSRGYSALIGKEDITGPYNCCSYEALTGPRPETLPLESDAYQNLRKVVLTKSFQRDLARASPYGGTSICETKNALDRLYCRKEIFYPVSTYHLYAKLATMHLNTLRLAEMAGERNVVRRVEVQRKYNRWKSTINFKNPVAHKWRDDILDEVFSFRLLFLNSGANDEDARISEDTQEMMDAKEIYSAEL